MYIKKIPIVFHNGSSHNYHKRISKRIKKNQLTSSAENAEKYITFTVPIEKETTSTDKNGEKITKNISYILQLIDSTRFIIKIIIKSSQKSF